MAGDSTESGMGASTTRDFTLGPIHAYLPTYHTKSEATFSLTDVGSNTTFSEREAVQDAPHLRAHYAHNNQQTAEASSKHDGSSHFDEDTTGVELKV